MQGFDGKNQIYLSFYWKSLAFRTTVRLYFRGNCEARRRPKIQQIFGKCKDFTQKIEFIRILSVKPLLLAQLCFF